ncbi:MAG: hypothetical protein HYT39_03795 [Candidatus Sungbacteria bacterium]|nr:hypothetical protein [Candidatus Sungbacteria bacterium]
MSDDNDLKKDTETDLGQVFVRNSCDTTVVGEQYRGILHLLDSGHPAKTDSGVGKAILLLASTIRESSLTSALISKKANRLIRWYVILTAILAVTTVIALVISLLKS